MSRNTNMKTGNAVNFVSSVESWRENLPETKEMAEDKKKNVVSALKETDEELKLASQADLTSVEDDVLRFEELLEQLMNLEGLTDRTEILRSCQDKIDDVSDDPTVLLEQIMEASLKVEEAAQLHQLRSMALLRSQLSLVLASSRLSDEDLEDAQKDVFEASRELNNIEKENMDKEVQIEELEDELQEIQEQIKEVEKRNTELKNASAPKAEKSNSDSAERISKLESQLEKITGRYNFTRFLVQLLLMAGKADFVNNRELEDLFRICGKRA